MRPVVLDAKLVRLASRFWLHQRPNLRTSRPIIGVLRCIEGEDDFLGVGIHVDNRRGQNDGDFAGAWRCHSSRGEYMPIAAVFHTSEVAR